MTLTLFQKIVLAIAGLTALAVGLFILLAPHAFYASYGIDLGHNPSLLSDLRAPAAGLATLGGVMLCGVFRSALAPFSVVVAFVVFFAFPVGRVVSLVVDGAPSGGILGAFALEIVIAGLCLVAFGKRAERPQLMSHQTG